MKLILNSRDEIMSINLDEVVYFLADGNFTRIVFDNKLILTVGISMAKMEKILAEFIMKSQSQVKMMRAGKSHIINVSKIVQINILKQQVLLSGGTGIMFTVNISRDAAKQLKQIISGGDQANNEA